MLKLLFANAFSHLVGSNVLICVIVKIGFRIFKIINYFWKILVINLEVTCTLLSIARFELKINISLSSTSIYRRRINKIR